MALNHVKKNVSASRLEPHPMRDMAQSLPIGLLKAREAIMGDFRAMITDTQLTDQQWRILRALAESPGLDVFELSEKCAILQSSVSRILRKMEGRNLISRRTLPEDRRRAVISITPQGQAILTRLAPRCEEIYRDITARFGQEKLDSLLLLLHDLTAAMQEE